MHAREELLQLVNTLPDAALAAAHEALTRMQTWPPGTPDFTRDAAFDHMQARMRERTETLGKGSECGILSSGGSWGGGSGRPRRGRFSFSYREAGVDCYETQILQGDFELTLTERIRVEDEPSHLVFMIEVRGPDGVTVPHEHRYELSR
jgi:hypothetical protein